MVKTLFKHEFNYYFNSFIVFSPFLLLVALFVRFLLLFNPTNTIIKTTLIFSEITLYVGCFVVLFLAFILSLVRFYKNMFSQEGYLTLTLPVTNFQHLFVKVVTSFINIVLSILIVCLSLFIATTDFDAFFNTISEFFSLITANGNTFVNILSIILFFIVLIVYLVYLIMLYYCCITVGQMSNKNRIVMAVLTYFGYYLITQFVGIIFVLAFAFGLGDLTFKLFSPFFLANPEFLMLFIFLFCIIIYGAQIVLFYYIIMKILNKKLNLE